jgi:hypothetical protein
VRGPLPKILNVLAAIGLVPADVPKVIGWLTGRLIVMIGGSEW